MMIDGLGYIYYKQGKVNMFDDDYVNSRSGRNAALGSGTRRHASKAKNKASSKVASPNPWGANTYYGGVEQADCVQTNGTHIFDACGRHLLIVDVATMTISSLTVITPHDIYYAIEMLLIEDRLVVFNSQYVERESMVVLVYNATTMTLLSNQTFPGDYVTAHAVGTYIHVTTGLPLLFNWYLEPDYIQSLTSSPLDQESYSKKAQEELELQLDPLVDEIARSLDCSEYSAMPSFLLNGAAGATRSLVTISRFDVTTPSSLNTTRVLTSDVWEVVFTEDHVVVVSQVALGSYNSSSATDFAIVMQTHLVAFKSQGASNDVVSIGIIPGTPVVDVQSGIQLFTTDGQQYIYVLSASNDEDISDDCSEYYVSTPPALTILKISKEANGLMPLVGQLTDLGKSSDSVQSALIQSHRAFVAVSGVHDSVFMLNMSDLAHPHAVGTVNVTGSTSHLLDLGSNLIMSIGEYRYNNTGQKVFGESGSLQLQLFDVSGHPRLVQRWKDKLSSEGNATEWVQIDHGRKVVRYIADRQILIVPMTIVKTEPIQCSDLSESDSFQTWGPVDVFVGNRTMSTCFRSATIFDGFRGFKINATHGITEYFAIDQQTNCSSRPSRSFVFDDTIVSLLGNLMVRQDLSMLEAALTINMNESSTC